MRWFFLLLSMVGFSFGFTTKIMTLAVLGLGCGFVGLILSILAFAAHRIQANAQSETALLTDKEVSQLRASVRRRADAKIANIAKYKKPLQ